MLQKNARITEKLKKIKPTGIRRLFEVAREIPNAINLGIGEPDFTSPKHVIDAIEKALKNGKTHYSPNFGIPELLEAISIKMKREYGLSYDAENQILVTIGAMEAFFLGLMAVIKPGDEVLIPDPGFLCYEPAVWLTGGVPVHYPLLESRNFGLDEEAVRSLITEKSRVMVINSPHNPTGSVLSYDELSKLAKLAVEHDLIVISDEVYEKITYDGVKHYCMAAFPGMKDRTIVINSFSKTYAMTGLRIGFAVGPEDLIRAMGLIHQYSVVCVSTPTQYGALAALEGPQDFVEGMVREFDRRRKLICSRLCEISGIKCVIPRGAFYVFPNIKEFGMSSEKFAEYLLREAKVATVPGSSFGGYGEGYLRISYAASYEQIEEAMDRIEKAVKKLKGV